MQRYIAFLRAINVGGHTVKMDTLRTLFEAMGFVNVQTFIASGNVIFDSPVADACALEDKIEGYLKEALGYEVGTFLRSTKELAAIESYQPFPHQERGSEGQTLMVVFLKSAPGDEARQKLLALQTDDDAFHVNEREVYWLCRTRISDSPAGVLLGKGLGKQGTMRNMTTVRKLATKYPVLE